MSLNKTKKKIFNIIFEVALIVLALVYIYPVLLMFMNSLKPFGEVVADVIALPQKTIPSELCGCN